MPFEVSDLEALQRAHAHHDLYYDLIHHGVRFKQYVGVIQARDLTVEILPKADKRTDADKEGWQDLLKEMLHISGLRRVGAISKAQLKLRHHTLLDVYIAHFLSECEDILRRGLVKTYRRQQGQVRALKGRLLFAEQIRYNAMRQDRMYTEHQVYDYGHLVNHILVAALEVLQRVVPNQEMRGQIARLLIRFPDLGPRPTINAAAFARIVSSRKLTHYEEALGMAKLILLNYSPDVRRGSEDVLAILFDMNLLWELFVYRVLKRGESAGGYKVSAQNQKRFWNSRRIRPDLVLTWADGRCVVVDTKWKLIDDFRPADADLKQMYAYNMYWQTRSSVLLYPGLQSQGGEWGEFHEGLPMASEPGNECKVATCRIWEQNGERISLKPNLADELIDLVT
ncbi:McrC family protein [Flavobacteriales bacterium]|nr:McrC family protein [Flavobacteriales bacterium]